MSLVVFVSGRSPGVTTAVHALALSWPAQRRVLLVEHDPDGGALAARHELPCEPGLTSLAAAGRRGLSAEVVLQHCRRLADGTVALLAPTNPELAGSALALLSGSGGLSGGGLSGGRGLGLASALAAVLDTDVLVDGGRIDRASPSTNLIPFADLVVLVVTPTLEGVAHAQVRLPVLEQVRDPFGRLAVVTVGRRPYGPDEVADALDLPALGELAEDRRGALDLASGRGLSRSRHRSELLRSAVVMAEKLRGRLEEPDAGGLRRAGIDAAPWR